MTHPEYTPSFHERFWSKVNKSSGYWCDGTECWEWTASRQKYGHGFFAVKGKNQMAHRISYQLAHGEIPDGMWVLHRCDRGWCVNPAHLFLGTVADNQRDMAEKGRARNGSRLHPESRPRGERHHWHTNPLQGQRHPNSKLTDEIVRSIRQHHEQGQSYATIASHFGIHKSAVAKVVKRETWPHVE